MMSRRSYKRRKTNVQRKGLQSKVTRTTEKKRRGKGRRTMVETRRGKETRREKRSRSGIDAVSETATVIEVRSGLQAVGGIVVAAGADVDQRRKKVAAAGTSASCELCPLRLCNDEILLWCEARRAHHQGVLSMDIVG
mmetsp:Transcript_24349/g.44686  ORF Transcript_24349/g.44686 Transcript_24349/m.44686 type:complete len:138 (+) Transcript_24349:776-1189(+)